MTWTFELTSSGYSVTWSAPCLAPGNSLAFYAGPSEDDMSLLFSTTDASGSMVLELEHSFVGPGASGRFDQMDGDGETIAAGSALPLAPGLSMREARELRFLAGNHARLARLSGEPDGRLYRRYSTGEACPDCCDPATGALMRRDCGTCGGSGRVEGWAGPYPTAVLWMAHNGRAMEGAGGGAMHDASAETVRLSALPAPRTDDKLLLPGGRLYIVGSPQRAVCGVRGVAAVVECPIKLPDPGTAAATIPDSWLE